MAFHEVFGQTSAITFLQKTLHNQRLPSAYLFVGPHHIGKQKTALALAQVINCEKKGADACLNCSPCRQIENQGYPDFSILEPDGQFIKISQIKEAVQWIQIRPSAGSLRVLVIDRAEQMNKESANAFLKTLEEPPPQTLIILLAEQTQQLLETIVSRCQIIRFQFLKKELIQQILLEQPGLSEADITFLSNYALGQIRPDWIENIEILQPLRDKVQTLFLSLSSENMNQVFEAVDEIGGNKEGKWGYMLDFLEYWLRDLEWLHLGLDQDQCISYDQGELLQQGLQKIYPERIGEAYQNVLQTRERISFNARIPLALDALWIELKNNLMV